MNPLRWTAFGCAARCKGWIGLARRKCHWLTLVGALKLCGFISNCGLNKINIEVMTSLAADIHRRRVELAYTDAVAVAHFSRLLAMVEEAEHGFFRERGIPILSADSAWPVVNAEVDFCGACRFGEEIEIRLGDFQPGKSSLAYAFDGAIAGMKVFSGKITKCLISPATGRSMEISERLKGRFNHGGHEEHGGDMVF